MADINSIRISWWNTGLAPAGKSRGTEERYSVAASVLRSLLEDDLVDLLALGETTSADVHALVDRAGPVASRHIWKTPRLPPARATSISVAYNSKRLTLLSDTPLEASFAGSTFLTGWHLVFEVCGGGDALNVVVVHWPSHVREEAAVTRQRIATALHNAFASDRDVVIIGDFNDEPFSGTMTDCMVAYRDRTLVRHRKVAYYNPFWRLLGERQHLEAESLGGGLPAGTHYYKSGPSSRWFTFDQIIVSSGLIGDNAWRLTEGATRIVLHDALITTNGRMRDVFDHLPIATSLTYTPKDDDG